MALRDQPYIPLYVQDYLTDEKLNNCSPSSQGIYIKIMCLFHKCDPYGGILLKQNDKQNENICFNFAYKLAKQLPFDSSDILKSLEELLYEKVLLIEGDFLYQKRMVKDNELSILRSEIGKKGGEKTQNKYKKLAKAKNKANTENEYVNEFDFKTKLLELNIEKTIVEDWLKVRSKKKASNTETAFNRIKNEIEKSGYSANDCIKLSVEKNWIGFEAEWMIKLVGKTIPVKSNVSRKVHYMMFGQPYTHFEKAYNENLSQYGSENVQFLNFVENGD